MTEIAVGFPPETGRTLYVGAFVLATLLTGLALTRIHRVDDRDTRVGLAWLLAGSGVWATATAGYLLSPTEGLAIAFHTVGLVVGLSTVGAWLYFTSAYTGRSFHRNQTVQWIGLATFLVIVAVKVTNPIHGIYYTTAVVSTPFEYVAVQNGLLHWTVMGSSYALSGIGFFMLLERFSTVSLDTRPLLVLVGFTGLPVLFDIVGFSSPVLIDIIYEPLGVAVFATGVFFVFLEQFQAVRLAGERKEPVVVLDDEDRIHQYNQAAGALFAGRLDGSSVGEPVTDVFPELPGPDADQAILQPFTERDQIYRVTLTPFTSGDTQLGRLLVFNDVTGEEEAKRELRRQNDRLEQLASTISHDLRNPLSVAKGRLELAVEESDSEHVEKALSAVERMETMIEDLLQLARQGQPIDETEPVSLEQAAHDAWEMVQTANATLTVTQDCKLQADPDRLASVFENLFRNAVEHAGQDVSVTVSPTETGFAVADDGPGIPPEVREEVFESGFTTDEDGTGFGLAIVSQIAQAHGWTVEVTESEAGGARFVFDGQ
ncbi:MAG: ATP-binding protein [Halodesulfurarchaeum sp.]